MLDAQGQPSNKKFNYTRNMNKSLMSLQGILKGLISDKKLNELELAFLNTWLISHRSLPHEGDVLDLLDNIEDIVSDGIVSDVELLDLQDQINDVVDYGNIKPQCVEDLTNELLGFISGISADNVISQDEFKALVVWLNENPSSAECWPGNILLKKIVDILADDVVELEELADLTQTCKMIAGQQFLETGAADGLSTEFCAQPLDSLPSSIKTISFTGKFLMGSRASLEEQARLLGIKPIKKEIPQYLDLLVIGGLASPDWRFSSHGRKIEKALINQQKGFPTLIITEENWSNLSSFNEGQPLRAALVSDEEIIKSKDNRQQVCFTGFSASKKKELIKHANNNNFSVVAKVTLGLDLLVYGDNAGPKKIEVAEQQGVSCINEEQFYKLI